MGWIHRSEIGEEHAPVEREIVRREEQDSSDEIVEYDYLEDRTGQLEGLS